MRIEKAGKYWIAVLCGQVICKGTSESEVYYRALAMM